MQFFLLFLPILVSNVLGQGSPFLNASVDNLLLTNEFRVQQGLTAVARDQRLESLAMQWSKHMYEVRNMYHSTYGMAENVASASGMYAPESVSQGFFTQWEESPGHRANMLGSSNKCGGVGIYGDGNSFYGTQLFVSDCVAFPVAPPMNKDPLPSPSTVAPQVSYGSLPSPSTVAPPMSQIPLPSPMQSNIPEVAQQPTVSEEPDDTITPTFIFTFDPLPTTLPFIIPMSSLDVLPSANPAVTTTPALTPGQQKRLRRLERLTAKLAKLERKLVKCVVHSISKQRKISNRCERMKRHAEKLRKKIQNLEQKLGTLVA